MPNNTPFLPHGKIDKSTKNGDQKMGTDLFSLLFVMDQKMGTDLFSLLFVMRPHAQHLHGADVFENFVN